MNERPQKLSEAIGFAKSAIGMCVDEDPHDDIRVLLWKVLDALHGLSGQFAATAAAQAEIAGLREELQVLEGIQRKEVERLNISHAAALRAKDEEIARKVLEEAEAWAGHATRYDSPRWAHERLAALTAQAEKEKPSLDELYNAHAPCTDPDCPCQREKGPSK